jgi:hypothetical protein
MKEEFKGFSKEDIELLKKHAEHKKATDKRKDLKIIQGKKK